MPTLILRVGGRAGRLGALGQSLGGILIVGEQPIENDVFSAKGFEMVAASFESFEASWGHGDNYRGNELVGACASWDGPPRRDYLICVRGAFFPERG